ncbi:HAD-IC family P-type ATPase [Amycolatopsis keratiniphila]|uniref:HAD-IC family P-type ATPase n=1 Tax=Amycolatopsis keratiniphila TaxID=129921 RepID=UPI00087BDAA2|nr:HAD-IC family P-type ATPase [Amycolatopsis keratiniphila]OLZ49626.1 haloacid dehalogenase [Amycolatopsis keratiniphila subsp. nogabecina]SDU22084.1 ATPase, P-type (transporting), HAD superfamily, subfamily IC [Amycolatopsis keratiniphila]
MPRTDPETVDVLGVAFPKPSRTLGRVARGLAGLALLPLEGIPGRGPRRAVWSCPGRLYIETHGVKGPEGARVARRVERALAEIPGVRWAQVNAPTSRVVVAVEDPGPRRLELIRAVERAESEPASEAERVEEDELHHPADGTTATRLPSTLAADAAGLMLSVATKIMPWAPLPTEVAALASLVDLHPRLRDLADRKLRGRERADSATSIGAALVHGLAARSEGTVLDIMLRGTQWREAKAHQRAWCEAESSLVGQREHAGADSVVSERPWPLPESAADRHARRSITAGAAAAAATLPFVGPRRAAAVGISALPKAPSTGTAAFAAQLGQVLARRGALVMDRSALRGLDLLDTIVIDTTALGAGANILSDLVPSPDGDPVDLTAAAFALFDPEKPEVVRRDGEWTLGPVDELDVTGFPDRQRLLDQGAHLVLGLVRDGQPAGLLAVAQESSPDVDALTSAAEAVGLHVVQTDGPVFDAVHELQACGRVVMLVSDDRRALGAADCGVGVHEDGTPPPWGAHVLIGRDVGTAVLLVEAITAAKAVVRDSSMFATAAGGIGGVTALSARRRPAASGLRAVNAGALMAFSDGIWRARTLTGERKKPSSGRVAPPWHLMPADLVLDRLGSSPRGLDEHEARRRAPADRAGGEDNAGKSIAKAFMAELANPLTPVLAGGAAVSAAVGSPVDAALVAGIVGVSALIGSAQQVHTDRALAGLFERSATVTTVVRDGAERQIVADDLVRGDVVSLRSGDVVPADCRVLEATGAELDESSLTGESLPVPKTPAPVVAAEIAERASILYEGTTVAAGKVTAVVVATGDETEVGRGMAAARGAAPETGVEARLASLTEQALPVAVGSAAAVAGAGLLRGVPLRQSVGAAVNLAVASVPEGLPFLVNAAQLAAARRLAEHGALVRNPRTIEALGRVDVLCFDKTGTLTEGRLSVNRIDDGKTTASPRRLRKSHQAVLAAAVRATPRAENPEELPHHTDQAILEGGITAGVDAGGWKKTDAVPFEPSRGFHATNGKLGERHVVCVKGAPEIVLPRCTRHGDRPMGAGVRGRLEKRAGRLAAAGHRVLAVAERTVSTKDLSEDDVADLRLLGFVALADPVRDSAAPAADRLREAGVRTVMITGDHPATGEAVSEEITGRNGDTKVLTGAKIEELDDEGLDRELADVDVIARCSPAQKVRIIQAYQRGGRVVAMTGDGANDAPAIRLADVGIALGQRGTAAARAAADLVVTDDRLETIVAALVEGRAMWASVREALGILLGGNLGEIAFTVLGSVVTGRSPLTARQLLLMNLLTDLAPALAIALSRPDGESVPELLREGPSASLGNALRRDITTRAVTTTLGASTAWTLARLTGRRRRASTITLVSLIGTQLGQTLAVGGRDGTVLAAGLGSAALLAILVQTPGVSQFFGCTPLGPVGWGIALGSAGAASVGGLLLGHREAEV